MGRDASEEKRLSLADLLIASLSSAAAAVIVHALWKPGTVTAAALTPILMSMFAEALRRPAEFVRVRTHSGDGGATFEVHRSRPRWGRAVVVGLAAFGLGAAGLTAAELVLNRAFAERAGDTTLFDGERRPAPGRTPDSASPTAEPTARRPARAPTATTDARRDRTSPSKRSGPTTTATPTAPAQPTPTPTLPAVTPTPPAATPTPP